MDVEAEVAGLATLGLTALRLRWTALTGGAAPQVGANMLRLAIAWEIQARVHGGLPRSVTVMLDQLARGQTRTQAPAAGMRLVREWGGKAHIVTVGDDQVIRWDEREWNSLSEVARAITGTRWSGPAFFGLKKKVAA